jgi:hypothetical protein
VWTACALALIAPAVSAQSLRDRLKKELRETSDAIEQKVDRAADEAGSGNGASSAASTATVSESAPPSAAGAAGGTIDLDAYLSQFTALANECRGLTGTPEGQACVNICGDSVTRLTAARNASAAIPQSGEPQMREALRICTVARDQAKNPRSPAATRELRRCRGGTRKTERLILD